MADADLPLNLTLECDEFLLTCLYKLIQQTEEAAPVNAAMSTMMGYVDQKEGHIGVTAITLVCRELKRQISAQFPEIVAKIDQLDAAVETERRKRRGRY